MSWGDRGEGHGLGWWGLCLGERKKIEDLLGWGLYLGEIKKIEDLLGWGLYLGEIKNWGYTRVGSLSGRMTNWGCTGVGFYLWERKNWGCTGVESLSGRKKKLRMYWGGVFIWEKEENDVLGWGPFGKTTTTATENVPLMKFIYLVFFTSMPGENYRRRLRSLLLYVCYVHRALITSLVCWFFMWRNSGSVHCKEIPLLAPVMHTRGRICRDHRRPCSIIHRNSVLRL